MTRRANPSGPTRQKPRRRSRHPKPWVLRDPELLSLVYQTFEDVTDLRRHCVRQVEAATEVEQVFGHLPCRVDQSGLQRWRWVSELVMRTWSLLDQIVRTNRFDPVQGQEAYRQLLGARMTWARLEPRSDSFARLVQITSGLRELLIRYAQAQGQRRRPQP